MKRKILCMVLTAGMLIFTSCSRGISPQTESSDTDQNKNSSAEAIPDREKDNGEICEINSPMNLIQGIKNKYNNSTSTQWGEKVNGVISRINTEDKVIALTFDACGYGAGNGYDNKLISYLEKENIPATLFINARWIDSNLDRFKDLSNNPLFEIENHGYEHKPLSINGKSAYNIKGTRNIDEAINEVYSNEKKIQDITGKKTKYFRSGTAYYDDVAVNIVKELGEKPVNFSVIGDAGATFSAEQIKKVSLEASKGSIIIYHMNHPEKSTADGIMKVIPLLKEKGFKFVKLEAYDKYLK